MFTLEQVRAAQAANAVTIEGLKEQLKAAKKDARILDGLEARATAGNAPLPGIVPPDELPAGAEAEYNANAEAESPSEEAQEKARRGRR